MNFTDKDTAGKFRETAMNELRSDIERAIMYGAIHADKVLAGTDTVAGEFPGRTQNVNSVIVNSIRDRVMTEAASQSRVYRMLILRSGIIYEGREGENVHDCILDYDTDREHNFPVAYAMRLRGDCLYGGVDNRSGQIHT